MEWGIKPGRARVDALYGLPAAWVVWTRSLYRDEGSSPGQIHSIHVERLQQLRMVHAPFCPPHARYAGHLSLTFCSAWRVLLC